MAARLATVGSDEGTWGTVTNTYLRVEHNADGTHYITVCNENVSMCYENKVLTNRTDFTSA